MSAGERSVRDRLRRLRREERASGPAADLSLIRQRARRASPSVGDHGEAGVPRELSSVNGSRGTSWQRLRRFERSRKHGDWALGELREACPRAVARAARDPQLEEVDLEQAIFLDIETTGLSGGAGTIPFLVGLGRFVDGEYELWQGFLRGPEEEAGLLEHAAERIAASRVVVSFFGKSFDRHRLEDKMRMHKIEPPFDRLPHLDLYYPLHRLYREAYPDGRLQTMERALCGVEREDDLPGSFAPEAWFDFLAGRPHRLEDVFRHNQDDVLSLVCLAAHLGRSEVERTAAGEPLAGSGAARARGWARLQAQARQWDAALDWSACARERTSGDDRSWLCFHADLLRRRGDAQRALELYRAVAQGGRDRIALEAQVQAAKIAEHDLRLWSVALESTEDALSLVREVVPVPREARQGELERRLTRLRRKCGVES